MGRHRKLSPRQQAYLDLPQEPSGNLLTPANAMTASRPFMARHIAHLLVSGERGTTPVWPWMLGLALSDAADGRVARLTDRIWPGKGRGETKLGAQADPVVDTLAFLTVAGATLRAPRVTRSAKFAVGVVLGAESRKVAWAVTTAVLAQRERGEFPEFPPVSKAGKLATVAKFGALLCATATHDVEHPLARRALSVAALGCALGGAGIGEQAIAQYTDIMQAQAPQETAPMLPVLQPAN